jgi:hypothetical protein
MYLKVYASMVFNEGSQEWVNLVMTEGGGLVMCKLYPPDQENQCIYDMHEESKLRLNQLFGDAKLGNSYKLFVVDPEDERLVKARELNMKKELRISKPLLRFIDKIVSKFVLFQFNKTRNF